MLHSVAIALVGLSVGILRSRRLLHRGNSGLYVFNLSEYELPPP
ncbi:hypothetical protein [Calothrix sp. NIES-3974]|nr:hypothetical protein [Calothrix sp. NIES-3974]